MFQKFSCFFQGEILDFLEVIPGPEGTEDNMTAPFVDVQMRLYIIQDVPAQLAAVNSGQIGLISTSLSSMLGIFATWVGVLVLGGEPWTVQLPTRPTVLLIIFLLEFSCCDFQSSQGAKLTHGTA